MSSTPLHPPIPRQPIGTTFVVSICILGAVAIIQLLALALHYLPLVRQQVAETARAQAGQQTVGPAAPVAQAQATAPPLSAEQRRAQQLLAEVDRSARVGDFEAALKSLREIEKLIPGDPAVLLRKAQIFERVDQPAEAALAIEEALKYPGLPPDVYSQAKARLSELSRQVAAMTPTQRQPTDTMREAGGTDIRDDVGLQPGAMLGLVEVRLVDGKPGFRNLRVAVKSRPGATIKVEDVKIHVYFYEQTDDGDVILTESKVVSQWLSPPIDWAANEPELLEVQYTLPENSSEAGTPGRKLFGYVVGIFYNNELQDFRSEPSKLVKDFPLPLYLKEGGG